MLRLIDANLNRIREGLRVLESIARFLLDDASILEPLKAIRHELAEDNYYSQRQLLAARRSGEEDVGAFLEPPKETKRGDFTDLVIANARRVEESLRVMEELAKLPNSRLEAARFEKARFSLYALEQELVSKLSRQGKREKMVGLCVIIDTQALRGRDEVEVTRMAIRGGAKVIQLRDKHRSKRELLAAAQQLGEICAHSGVLFIINDYPDIAIACDADGVHLGQDDLPLVAARHILPYDKLIGCSTASVEQALKAEAEGADYISVGSIFPTQSKERVELVGLEMLRRVKDAVSLPVVAIGGINQNNVTAVVEAGAKCVAVISAILGAEDVEGAARQLATRIDTASGEQG